MTTNGTSPEQLETDIARQREELADTVDALQAKLDVKSRAKHRASVLRGDLTTASGAPRPELLGAVGLALAVLGVVVWRRRRS